MTEDPILVGSIDPTAHISLVVDSEAVLPDGSKVKLPAGTRIDVPNCGMLRESEDDSR